MITNYSFKTKHNSITYWKYEKNTINCCSMMTLNVKNVACSADAKCKNM